MPNKPSLTSKLRRIKMLLLDVDGVMTDGGLYYTGSGVEMKRFNAHDGYGVVLAREHGLNIGIISGRRTPIVDARAFTLKVEEVFQDAMDKVAAMRDIQRRNGLADEEFAFVGDELFDLPLLRVVGFSAAPRNARPEVQRAVDYVTSVNGGDGAVREIIELILHAQRPKRTKA